MQTSLQGKAAIVTGGSKGIGKAIAAELAHQGAKVMICARGIDALEQTAQELKTSGATVEIIQADMTRPDDIERLADDTASRFGRIDILINNAVASTQNSFEGLADSDWNHHIDVKLLGYVRACRAVLPHLRQHGWGRIVNVVGMSARIVTAYRMTNGAVNAAVTNFTKHLAEQTGKDGITVNAIHPGYTRTPRLENGFKEWSALDKTSVAEIEARRVAEIPIGRLIEPADLAYLAAFLCSERAGAITGQAIAVDGGSGRGIGY